MPACLLLDLSTFLHNHEELLIALIPLLIALVKTTSWGKANQQALIVVTEAVESVAAKHVKEEVADKQPALTPQVQDAIQHAVAVADPGKTPKTGWEQIVTELCRGLMKGNIR